jgi:hypothetical protein
MSRAPHVKESGAQGGGAQILAFRRPATFARKRRDAPITDPLRHLETEEDRLRLLQNLAAAAVVALLLATGLWLIDRIQTSAQILSCLETATRNCLRVDVEH